MGIIAELKRRNVFRIGIAYLVVSWLILQLTDVLSSLLDLPHWVGRLVFFLLLIGFPVALILAWAFELTSEGIKLDKDVDRIDPADGVFKRKLDFVIIGLMAIAILYLVLDNYVLDRPDPLAGQVDVSRPVPGFSNRAAIAVLPFINLSDDPAQEYFSDGITEDLITGLQSIRRFPVIARASTFAYKGKPPDIRVIAEALGAGYILAGSVRKAGDRVRINAQLLDATGRHVWAEFYDSKLHDIFAVQDKIRHQIIGAIEPELMQAEIGRAGLVRTEDMEAWDYYLQSAAYAPTFSGYVDRSGQPATVESIERALVLARSAIELDPTFADAYMLLGHVSTIYAVSLRGAVSDEIADQAMRDGFDLVSRGRELSPFSASACSCYVWYLTGYGLPDMFNLDVAVEIQKDAVRLNPANAIARAVLGLVYQARGQYDEALLEVQIAKRLSPRDLDFSFFLTVEALAFMGLGEWETAAVYAQRAILMTPLNYEGHAIRITALYASGDKDKAVSALADMKESIPHFTVDMLPNGPLPGSLASAAAPLLNTSDNVSYRQAIAAILNDLGWIPER